MRFLKVCPLVFLANSKQSPNIVYLDIIISILCWQSTLSTQSTNKHPRYKYKYWSNKPSSECLSLFPLPLNQKQRLNLCIANIPDDLIILQQLPIINQHLSLRRELRVDKEQLRLDLSDSVDLANVDFEVVGFEVLDVDLELLDFCGRAGSWVDAVLGDQWQLQGVGLGLWLGAACGGPAWDFLAGGLDDLQGLGGVWKLRGWDFVAVVRGGLWFWWVNFKSNVLFEFILQQIALEIRWLCLRLRLHHPHWLLHDTPLLTDHTRLRKHPVLIPFNRISPANLEIRWRSFTIPWRRFVHCKA